MNNKKYTLGDKLKVENVKTLDLLKNINPKFADHMYYKNRIVEAFALSEYGGIDMLEQPMCGKCEQPGFFVNDPNMKVPYVIVKDEYGENQEKFIHNCYCPHCGTVTKNTLTLREYLMQELKLPVSELRQLEELMYGGKAC